MTDRNRNGHLSRFEAFAPIKRSIEEIVDDAIAFKRGERAPEPEPTLVASFITADLVRYRLNSKALYDAYVTMGDKDSDPYDDHGYADRSARFGVIDRASGDPVAMLWVVSNNRDGRFEVCHPSFSKTRSLEQTEMLEVLRELDIPPSRRSGDDGRFARNYDLWYENGEWTTKEPRQLAAYEFQSICFATDPVMRDTITVFVPIDPAFPLIGDDGESAGYEATEHYRNLAHQKFWGMRTSVQKGYSSWMGYGDPVLVKVTDASLYNEFWPTASELDGQPSTSP